MRTIVSITELVSSVVQRGLDRSGLAIRVSRRSQEEHVIVEGGLGLEHTLPAHIFDFLQSVSLEHSIQMP
jgi:hypothetical protein